MALGATYGATHTFAERCQDSRLTGECKDSRLTGIATSETHQAQEVRENTLNCTLAAAALSGFLAPQ